MINNILEILGSIKCTIKISFTFLFNVATRKIKMTYMAHSIFIGQL